MRLARQATSWNKKSRFRAMIRVLGVADDGDSEAGRRAFGRLWHEVKDLSDDQMKRFLEKAITPVSLTQARNVKAVSAQMASLQENMQETARQGGASEAVVENLGKMSQLMTDAAAGGSGSVSSDDASSEGRPSRPDTPAAQQPRAAAVVADASSSVA